MKKKILFSLCLIALLFSFTACGSSNSEKGNDEERESKKYQEGFVEGKYSIKNLTFNLPDVYNSDGNNSYSYIGDGNGIRVEFYVTENYEGTLDEYINKDSNKLYPVFKSMEEQVLNGNHWLKGTSTDNDTLYYIKDGKDIYSIDVAPLFTTIDVFNELVNTIESSLYFK